mmetsp:Transcript_36637/g.103417  ORF Transcript_36637/g.103417 Transcript_36637/m.103417 type:complete len:172 (+) Transcript_36637:403-918(+)
MILGLTRSCIWSKAVCSIPGLPPISWEHHFVPRDACTLSGDTYYVAKSRLLEDEQVLLRTLQFQVTVELPQTMLFNLCRALDCSPGVTRLALCLLNDSMQHTDLMATCTPALLAAASLQLSFVLIHRSSNDTVSNFPNPYWATGLSLGVQELEEACHRLLDSLNNREDQGR